MAERSLKSNKRGSRTKSSPALSTGPAAPPRRSWSNLDRLAGLVLVLAVVLVYQPVGHAGYLWDDDVLLTTNPCIVGPLGLKEIWTSRAADICPLTITSFWVEQKLWGLTPVPYHLVSMLLHAACALLLWRVLSVLQVPGAWLGAALWALHPVQVESVAWISEMKNTQSGVFYLLAILCFLAARRATKRRVWLEVGTVLCAALALASKTSTMVLPVVLCLLAWWQEGRWQWRTLLVTWPIFLLSTAAGVLSIWMQALHPETGPGLPAVPGWPQRLVITGKAVWFYLGKLAWPHPLITVYPRWEVNPAQWSAFVPLLAAIIVLLVLWRQRHAWTWGGLLAYAYFLVVMFPVLGPVEISYFSRSFVADHFLYLASMGPLALAGAGLGWMSKSRPGWAGWQGAMGAALLLILGLASWQRTGVYESQKTLWTDTLAKNPRCGIGYTNLGAALTEEGRLDEAAGLLRTALQIDPNNAEAHYNLGVVFLRQGQVDEQIVQYQAALKANPRFALADRNLAAVLLQKGQVDEAIRQYQAALQVDPGNANTYYDLGNIFLQKGQVDEAIRQYQEALKNDSRYAPLHRNLGLAFIQKGQVNDAIIQYQEALKIDPGFALVHGNLGFALMQEQRVDEAIVQYQEALKSTPDDAYAHHNLGMILARQGRLAEAITELQEAIRLKPDYSEARRDLVTLQAAARRAAGVP